MLIFCRMGDICSYSYLPESIRAATFCTCCNFPTLCLFVPDQTDKQWKSLEKTKQFITIKRGDWSRKWRILLIIQNLPIRSETSVQVCSLKERNLSSTMPKSFTEVRLVSSLPINIIGDIDIRLNICGDPKTHSLVLPALTSSWFIQQQEATLIRSLFSSAIALSLTFLRKETYSFESSTYDSILLWEQTDGKSLMYKLNKSGPSIDPCGTPCFKQVAAIMNCLYVYIALFPSNNW